MYFYLCECRGHAEVTDKLKSSLENERKSFDVSISIQLLSHAHSLFFPLLLLPFSPFSLIFIPLFSFCACFHTHSLSFFLLVHLSGKNKEIIIRTLSVSDLYFVILSFHPRS